MDPPPPTLFPHSITIPASSAAHPSHPDSANSSPRSRPDTWDDQPLPPIPGAKLRFMCSYGGHIIPRPHDKSLCYVGGETRIVVVDRHSSLTELQSRLSHTLLNGRHFTLKYQLPTEDLDSLISLATDEDLENMIEEYDRTISASPLKPSRLRLFLFPSKPETAASMGSLLDDAKSETWFVDALNGSGLLPRGLSESAGMDSLLKLNNGMVNSDSCADLEAQNESLGNNNKQVVSKSNAQEVVLDSPPMVETTSSFGSTSSSPSMANLPPIMVRVEDYQMVGLDEQFSHASIASSLANAALPSLPYGGFAAPKSGGGANASAVGGENVGRVICDDEKTEKSENGTVAPTVLRKPPLPLQPVQRKLVDINNLPSPDSKHAGGYNFPSPDSVASDCSIASAGSLSKHTFYQDNRLPSPITDQKMINSNNNNNIQEPTSQVQQNQQFIHPNTPYIQHPPMPISSYYPHPMYLQQSDHPQYPMYLLPPLAQTQPSYDAPIVTSARPLTPPIYPAKPDMYSTGATPMLVQVPPPHQFQQQYINLSQVPPPPQSNAPVVSAPGANYGYEYASHVQDQVYYSSAALPPQYQSMTPAAAVMLSQATSTVADNISQQS